jgi:hypothetical protein
MLSSELDWERIPVSCTVDLDQVLFPRIGARRICVPSPGGGNKGYAYVVFPEGALEERRRLYRQGGHWRFRFNAVLTRPVRELFLGRGAVVAVEWRSEDAGEFLTMMPGEDALECRCRIMEAALEGDEECMLEQARRLRHVTREVDVRYYRKDGQQPPVDVGGFLVDM